MQQIQSQKYYVCLEKNIAAADLTLDYETHDEYF